MKILFCTFLSVVRPNSGVSLEPRPFSGRFMGRSGNPRFGQNAVSPSGRFRSESGSSGERSPRVPSVEVCHLTSRNSFLTSSLGLIFIPFSRNKNGVKSEVGWDDNVCDVLNNMMTVSDM